MATLSDPLSQPEHWGAWEFIPDQLELVFEKDRFRVPLRQVRSSACMLDYIFQVNSQSWATNDVIRALLNAFQDLFDPRATLCSDGKPRSLDAEAYLRHRPRTRPN